MHDGKVQTNLMTQGVIERTKPVESSQSGGKRQLSFGQPAWRPCAPTGAAKLLTQGVLTKTNCMYIRLETKLRMEKGKV